MVVCCCWIFAFGIQKSYYNSMFVYCIIAAVIYVMMLHMHTLNMKAVMAVTSNIIYPLLFIVTAFNMFQLQSIYFYLCLTFWTLFKQQRPKYFSHLKKIKPSRIVGTKCFMI